jgi:hypothetical protein
MEEDQILDSALKEITVHKGVNRWNWHFKHAAAVIGLHFLVVFIREGILPYLPEVASDLLTVPLGILIMLGSYFITGYVSRLGYQWNWGLVLIGASFIFFSSFIYAMTSLDHWTEVCSPKLKIWTSMSDRTIKKVLEILLVGVIYSCVAIPLVEIFTLLTDWGKMLYRFIKKESVEELGA